MVYFVRHILSGISILSKYLLSSIFFSLCFIRYIFCLCIFCPGIFCRVYFVQVSFVLASPRSAIFARLSPVQVDEVRPAPFSKLDFWNFTLVANASKRIKL